MIHHLSILAAVLITNTVELSQAVRNGAPNATFSIEGVITCLHAPTTYGFLVDDGLSSMEILNRSEAYLRENFCPGDVVRIFGQTGSRRPHSTRPILTAIATRIIKLGRSVPPPPANASISQIKSGNCNFRFVRTHGKVTDIFRDEIDPEWSYLILNDANSSLYVTVYTGRGSSPLDITTLLDADVSVTGICSDQHEGDRMYFGSSIIVADSRNISVVRPSSIQPFSTPMLDETVFPSPESILSVGLRRLAGQVLAVWNGNHLLVRSTNQVIHTIEIADSHLPACGQWVETVGILETDLYHLNLSNAIWRPFEWDDKSSDKPIDISPAQLLTDGKGNSMLHSEYNGQRVRITGVVQDMSLPGSHSPSFLLKDGHVTITVRADACPQALDNLSAGSHVILTGICVLKTTNWHSYARFPHATELFVALQKASDVTITARPPWWTPGRLATVIGALLSLLIGFVAWNRILNRLVNRRSRELFQEQVAHYGATLRIDERTRLAVELHDSLSQVLTAVAMEVEAVRQTAPDARPETNLHLDIAQKTLSSCRNELRNCLWDLRNLALDEPDMNMAISKTLLPHIKNIKTAIRFNIPRARFSDNTIHSILQIIRELTVNAIRHGNATFIQIAGGIEGDLLKFSVTNDGAPFDINACPSITQGHFGLQGIRERLRKLEGTLSVSCSAKRGVRVKVTMKIPQPSAWKANDL